MRHLHGAPVEIQIAIPQQQLRKKKPTLPDDAQRAEPCDS